jgi:hypothetical protein
MTSPAEVAAEIAVSIMWGPKTRAEIGKALGVASNHTPNLQKYLDEFRQSGCIHISGWTTRGAEVYGWQTKPFKLSDAKKPEIDATAKKTPSKVVRVVEIEGVPMTREQASKRLGLSLTALRNRIDKKLPLTKGDLRKCQTRAA